MKHLLTLLGGLAIAIAPSTTQAQIDWAMGAPGGTPLGSIELVDNDNLFLATGISAAQVAPATGDGDPVDYTIAAWIKSSVDDGGGLAANGHWWFGTGNQGLHLGINGFGINGLTTDHWSADTVGTTAISVNTWVHATHVYRDGVQEIWLNGVMESSAAQGAPNRDSADLQIGSRNGGNGPSWGGCIDDVAIFTRALSGDEIELLVFDSALAPDMGAAAYYNFEDDQTGTTALNLVDVAVSGLTGTDGSPAFQQLDGINLPPVAEWSDGAPMGTSGGSLRFDGSGPLETGIAAEIITGNRGGNAVPGNPGLDYSVAAWINSADATEDGNAADNRWWFGTGNQGLHLGIQAGNTLQHGHWSADSSGTSVIPANTWVHVAYVYDADGGVDDETGAVIGAVTIYRDGDPEGPFSAAAPNNSSTDLIIGGRNGFGGPAWVGLVDDVAIFTDTLTGGEVQMLMADASAALSLDAVAYYNFEDDQTGSTAANLVDVAMSGLFGSSGEPALQALEGIGPPTMAVLKGDVDLNGAVEFADIPAFIQVLIDQGNQPEADADCNGEVEFADIPAFINLLIEAATQ